MLKEDVNRLAGNLQCFIDLSLFDGNTGETFSKDRLDKDTSGLTIIAKNMYAASLLSEMIAVIAFFQFLGSLIKTDAVCIGDVLHGCLEISHQFILGNSAYALIPCIHGNINEVVEVAEHADLSELRHTREESELDIFILSLEHGVESFQRVAEMILKLRAADGLQHRLVVFVHENDNTLVVLLCDTFDKTFEAKLRRYFGRIFTVNILQLAEKVVEHVEQSVFGVVLTCIEVKIDDGIDRPVLL